MSLFRKLFARKAEPTRPFLAVHDLGQPVSSPRTYRGYSEEGYKKAVIAYRCVDYIATAVAEIQPCLFSGAGRRKKLVEGHPILDLLDTPNPMQSREAYLKAVMSYFLIGGNSFVFAAGTSHSPTEPPRELWTLRPDRMKITPSSSPVPAGYVYEVNSVKTLFPVDIMGRSQVMHIKTFNPTDDWWGMSPLEAAAISVDQIVHGNLWNLRLMQSGAKPPIVFKLKADEHNEGNLAPDQRERMKEDYFRFIGGAHNAGNPLFLEGGMDVAAIGLSPTDMDWLNGKKISTTDVANAYGVPGQLVGIEGSQTFANYEQARLAFYQETVIPHARSLYSHLNTWLVSRYGDKKLYLEPDIDGIDALSPLREKRWTQVQNATWLTVNEKRELTGYGRYQDTDTDEPGDKILVQSTMIPLDQAAGTEEAEPLTDTEDVGGAPPASPTGDPGTDDESEGAPGDREEENGDDAQEREQENEPPKAFHAMREGKHFNLKSEAAKRAAWRTIERDRMRFEKAMKAQVAGVFRKEGRELVASLTKVDRSLFEYVVNRTLEKSRPEMRRVLKTNIEATMRHFGEQVLSLAKHAPAAPERKDAADKFESHIQHYVESTLDPKLSKILHTTKKRVMKRVKDVTETEDGLPAAEFEAKIGEGILSLYASMEDARAETISRTETHMAAQDGSRAAAKALQIPSLKKEWVAAEDERTRESHAEVSGTVIPMDDKFEVSSEDGTDMMDGPGDPAAGLDNLINCRCALVYSTDESADTGESDE